MILVDIGCPNSVISVHDFPNLKKNLSRFQRENLKMRDVEEKFKFGPSGPYKCSKRIRFPISKSLWAEILLVDAKIPMLLGNNILKPLGAQITLFSTGNGLVKIKEEEIELKETAGGHYIMKVSDLGKFCENFSKNEEKNSFPCDVCSNAFQSVATLKHHKEVKHRHQQITFECRTSLPYRSSPDSESRKPALKKPVDKDDHENSTKNILADLKGENSYKQIETDINTLINGKLSKKDQRMEKY